MVTTRLQPVTNSFANLTTEALIGLTVDYIKVGCHIPEDLVTRLTELELLDVLLPRGANNED